MSDREKITDFYWVHEERAIILLLQIENVYVFSWNKIE
jgi:hypothetical protein